MRCMPDGSVMLVAIAAAVRRSTAYRWVAAARDEGRPAAKMQRADLLPRQIEATQDAPSSGRQGITAAHSGVGKHQCLRPAV